MSLPYLYRPLDAIRRALFDADNQLPLPSTQDLEFLASAAGWALNEYTHRTFAPVVETRTFDAPASTRLDVPDLAVNPAPVITLAGVTLVAGTDYLLQPESPTALQPTYTSVVRLQSGFARRWGYKPLGKGALVTLTTGRWGEYDYFPGLDAPYGPYAPYAPQASDATITIAGKWGWAAADGSVPEPIQLAHEILTIQLWLARIVKYQPSMPPAPAGKQPVDLIAQHPLLPFLLAPFVYQPTPEAVQQ